MTILPIQYSIISSDAQEPYSQEQRWKDIIQAIYEKSRPNSWQGENSLGVSIQAANTFIFGGPAIGMRPDLSSHIFGGTLGVNGLGNLVNIPANCRQIAYAKKIGDRRAVQLGGLSLAANVLSTISAISIGGGFRIASIVSLMKGAPSLYGRVSNGFLFAGLSLFSIWNIILLAMSGLQIYEGYKWKKLVNRKEQNVAQKIQLLRKKLELGSEEYIEKLMKRSDEYKNQLEKEAIKTGIAKLRYIVQSLGISIKEEELLEILQNLLSEEGEFQIGEETLNFIQKIGFDLKLEAVNKKREDKLMRVIGNNKVLLEKIRSGEATEDTIEAIAKEIKRTILINTLSIPILVLSIGAMVIGMVCTGGIGVLVGAILMGVCSLGLLALDMYCFNRALKNDQPTLYNKKQVVISTVATIISFAAIIALQIAGVISLGIVPLTILVAVTLFWILYNVYTWHILSKHQSKIEKTEEKSQDLEKYKEFLLVQLNRLQEDRNALEHKKTG